MTLTPEAIDAAAKTILAQLAPWQGGRATPWDYTVSHSVLRLRLHADRAGACIVLYMFDCESVSMFSGWDDLALRVDTFSSEFGPRFRVSDGARFNVDCASLALSRVFDSYAEIPPDPFRSRAHEPMVALSASLREHLDRLFTGLDRDLAEGILTSHCGVDLVQPSDHARDDLERLRRAVLRLSEGKLVRLQAAVFRAEGDWKVVVEAADFGQSTDTHQDSDPDAG
jgi:hypothetical protein